MSSTVRGERKTMREWIVNDEDLGCDGAYFSYAEIVRCKDCKYYWKNNSKYKSNMEDLDDLMMCLASPKDEAFCSEGERRQE